MSEERDHEEEEKFWRQDKKVKTFFMIIRLVSFGDLSGKEGEREICRVETRGKWHSGCAASLWLCFCFCLFALLSLRCCRAAVPACQVPGYEKRAYEGSSHEVGT